jgi:hypothetical protein
MSTQFFNDSVNVTINRGDAGVVNIGTDIRNTLLVTSHTVFTDSYRKYKNKNELLLDGFTRDSFAYRFAEIYFAAAVDPYDTPNLLISGGIILPNAQDYITKISKVLASTGNFGFIVTDIRYRTDKLPIEDEYQFIFDMATYIESSEKFYAVWLDEDYIPSVLSWIYTNNNEVILTDTPTGLMTESSTEEF